MQRSIQLHVRLRTFLFFVGLPVAAGQACGSSSDKPPVGGAGDEAGHLDATADTSPGTGSEGSDSLDGPTADRPVIPFDDASMPAPNTFCSLPGSVVSTQSGLMVVPGFDDSGAPDPMTLGWLDVPVGFCAHYFAKVPEVRQLRVAPGGDVFAASPSAPCTGGAYGGMGAIVVLPDDNHDGVADSLTPYLSSSNAGSMNIGSTQGLTFSGGYFYFQAGTTIGRVPFSAGDRAPSGSITTVTTITAPQASEHWPKAIDVAQDGTLYVTNGSTQGQECLSSASPNYVPVFGAIFKVDSDGSPSVVATGFRNPIAMRCEQNHNVCIAAELVLDGSATTGGREKLVQVRPGDNWGFPCCAAPGTPYQGIAYGDTNKTPDCSGVTTENVSFEVGHTPFGIDFEPGLWPSPWTGRAFVTLHGDVGSWIGARVVGIALDPTSGSLLPASDIPGGTSNANDMVDFATGWDNGMQSHGRPAPVTFGADGRMYLGDDMTGLVVWIAPITLPMNQ